MQTAPQSSLYLHFLISRLPGWGSPLEKMRFFSKSGMIAGSSLQIGPTTSLSCGGEASTLGSHYLSGILKRLRKRNHVSAGSVGNLHDSSKQKPREMCGPTKWTLLCVSWCLFWAELIESIFSFADQILPSWLLCTPVTRMQENTSLYFFFKIKLDSKVHGPGNIAGRCMEMEQRLLWTIAGGNEGSGRAAGTAHSECLEEAWWRQRS